MQSLVDHVLAIFLASLRIAPLIAFTPPFTLVGVPPTARATIVVALATLVAVPGPLLTSGMSAFPAMAASELALGIALALPLQLAFALIAMAGRTLDIQAGFGLAFLLDPTTRAQTPLIGALFLYAAAAVFFLTSGPADTLAVLADCFARVPVGSASAPRDAGIILEFLAAGSVLSLGLVGLAVIVLFLIDLVIAMMSRTLPQMNVLVFGFQIKALVTMLVLPVTLALAASGFVRLIRLALEASARIA